MSKSLHELIHQMSANEKGYFKKFADKTGHKGSKYQRLFDAIEKLPEWDQKAVLKGMKGSETKYLSADKYYLHQQVVESLLVGGSRKSVYDSYWDRLREAKLLADMDLHEQSFKQITKVLTLAVASEQFNLAMEALDLEIRIWVFIPNSQKRELSFLFAEKDRFRRAMSISDEARLVHVNLLTYYRNHGMPRTAQERESYGMFAKQARRILKQKSLPVSARVYANNALAYYHHVKAEAKKVEKHFQDLLQALDENTVVRIGFLNLYISTLTNYALSLIYSENLEAAAQALPRFEALKTNNSKEAAALFICKYNVYFQFHYRARDNKQGAALLQQFVQEEKSVGEKPLDVVAFLYFYCSRAAFLVGDFRGALRWLNRILHSGDKLNRTETYRFARLLEMLIHLERNNLDLLESLLNSARRAVRRSDDLESLELLFYDFCERILEGEKPGAARAVFREELESISETLVRIQAVNHFDFVRWANASVD